MAELDDSTHEFEVNRVAFAPQDQTSGRLSIGRLIVSR